MYTAKSHAPNAFIFCHGIHVISFMTTSKVSLRLKF